MFLRHLEDGLCRGANGGSPISQRVLNSPANLTSGWEPDCTKVDGMYAALLEQGHECSTASTTEVAQELRAE